MKSVASGVLCGLKSRALSSANSGLGRLSGRLQGETDFLVVDSMASREARQEGFLLGGDVPVGGGDEDEIVEPAQGFLHVGIAVVSSDAVPIGKAFRILLGAPEQHVHENGTEA